MLVEPVGGDRSIVAGGGKESITEHLTRQRPHSVGVALQLPDRLQRLRVPHPHHPVGGGPQHPLITEYHTPLPLTLRTQDCEVALRRSGRCAVA
jgi:hypothetical protein